MLRALAAVLPYHDTWCLCIVLLGGKILVEQGGENVMYNNKVDIVFTAHEHTYERTFQVYNHTAEKDAPMYMLQGSSGNREGNKGDYPPLEELPDWVAAVHNDVGYGILTQSANGNTLSWSFFRSADQEMLDSVTMSKN